MLLTLKLRDVLPATPRSRLVRLDLGGQPFSYAAGQAVKVGAHGGALRKPYSLASAPEDVAAEGWIELLIGLEGRFWRPRPDLRTTDTRRFREPLGPGLARAAWDFRLEPLETGATRLSTETRVRCADAAARRRFRPYWLLVRPGSGLILRAMLAAIRRAAEAPAETHGGFVAP